MKEKLLKIIEHYGTNKQQRKLAEEMFELQEAVTQFECGLQDDVMNIVSEMRKDHIIEEIADVLVLLRQFQLYYKIDDEKIKRTMNFKIKRTIERIEGNI